MTTTAKITTTTQIGHLSLQCGGGPGDGSSSGMAERDICLKQGLVFFYINVSQLWFFTKSFFFSCKSSELTNQVLIQTWGCLVVSCGDAGELSRALQAVIRSNKFSRSADVEQTSCGLPRENNAFFRWRALQPQQPGSLCERRKDHRYGGLR